jgi:hypothetical protein
MIELNQNLLAEIGGWPALKEARGLVERGRVRDVQRDGAIVRGKVQGAEKVYDAQIVLADRVANVEVKCMCAESRRSGRVCAHSLAVGLASLQGSRSVAAAGPRGGGEAKGTAVQRAAATGPRLLRYSLEEAPAGTMQVELTVLLPLQLNEALGKNPVRILLEARPGDDAAALPFDAVIRELKTGFAVSEEDEAVLAALERATGGVVGVNSVPRGKMGVVLRALDGHPRVWIGKKQRIEVRAATERPRILLSTTPDGDLELVVAAAVPSGGAAGSRRPPGDGSARGPAPATLPLPGWHSDRESLAETAARPLGFSSDTRLIPRGQIPDFLSREFPVLERSCELVFAPGFEEFRLEVGRPMFEAKLEGALSGLTLELVANYGTRIDESLLVRARADSREPGQRVVRATEEGTAARRAAATGRPDDREAVPPTSFSLNGKTESSAYQRYVADARQANRFWRRNVIAEREALAQVEAAGFSLVRSGAATFSLISENNVARFLANTLPRWRRVWTVTMGSRLEATMAEVDIAQPEFSLKGGAGNDWLGLDLKLTVAGKPIALDQSEIQRWLQTGQSHARTANKRVLLVPTEAWSEMKEVLADCEVEQEPGSIRVGRTFAPYLSGALTAQGFRAASNAAIDFSPPDVKAVLDAKLWAQLRPYQAQGVEWMAGLAQRQFHGLLADDMGLGKTLQALAFAAWVQKNVEVRTKNAERTDRDSSKILPTLVVCPTSLVVNWLREAARFTPQLRALDLTGANRAEKFARRYDYDLLVTSYAILRRDVELYRSDEFGLVILDEAQHIKNRSSQNAQSAKALRARHRLILTGTPLENSVLDLWSLYDFLLPGYLGTAAAFKERYETPLTKQPSGTPDAKILERLRQRVKPFFLRRTKEQVLTELPPKLEFPTLCELSGEQKEVYQAVLAQGRREVFEHSDKAGRNAGRDRMAVLTTLLRLRQVCCHLDLLPTERGNDGISKLTELGDGAEQERATKLLGQGRSQVQLGNEEGTEGGASGLHPSSFTPLPSSGRWKEPSAKMERTFELIDEAIDGGHRVLLFSQFVRVLHLLRDEAKRRELRFCYLDGQTAERQAEVDRFQNDVGIPLFFISLKAGGTGLNLTGADTVIHFDPWWNPAVEEQATSRAHRMGQARSVSAYKLIAAGTVEEKIQALQARKRELFEASIGGDAAFVKKLTDEDLEELLAE